MSISIKTCPECDQVNPGFHEFCPVCGADLQSTSSRAAPWTISSQFPPLAAAVDPGRKRHRRPSVPEGRGVGMAWIGAILAALPVVTSNETTLGLASWGIGIALVVSAFWLMRRDPYTLARAGAITNGFGVLALAIIGMMLVRSGGSPGPSRQVAALSTPTPTSVPDWAVATDAATPDASVAMYRGNAAHTGELPGPGITGRPYRVWRFDTAGEIYSSPAVVDGTVYIGSKSGFLFALDAKNGDERWRANLGDYIVRSSPAVVDRQVYIGAGYTLFALDAKTGQQTWQGRTSFSGSSSPSYYDGAIYVASQSSTVYSFEAKTGKMKWAFQTDGPVFSSPAVQKDLVFVGTDSGKLLALNIKTGQTRWTFETEGGIFSSPAISGQLVYITSKGGKTYALDTQTGTLRWSYDAGGEASPAVAGGTVYVAGSDGGLYALDAAAGGPPKWLFPTGSAITASPVIAAGVVYVASGSTLYAIDATAGTELWRYGAGYRIDTSPVVVNGFIFIAGKDGYLDAITGDGSH